MIRAAFVALGRLLCAVADRVFPATSAQVDELLWDAQLCPVSAHAEMACALLTPDDDYLSPEG